MSVHIVYCGVGSNLGDRAAYLNLGAEALSAHPAVTLLRKSGIYETEPQYPEPGLFERETRSGFISHSEARSAEESPSKMLRFAQHDKTYETTSSTHSCYLNMVWELETSLAPLELLNLFMRIEENSGRDRKKEVRWAPRTLDLDILFYDDWVFHDTALIIPHPRLHERRFVLEPLAELAPNFIHPVLGSTVWTMLSGLKEIHTVP